MLRHTTSEKIPELTRCFRWFAGLCVLNILTFWVPFIWASSGGRNAVIEWGLVVGLAVTGVVIIYFIHRLSRFAESRAVWFYLPFALVPFFSVVVLLLLAARSSAEVTRLGGYARLLPPRVSAGLVALAILAFGLLLLYMQVSEDIDHVRLKRGGQPITGTLRMVTKHSVNFIPTSNVVSLGEITYSWKKLTALIIVVPVLIALG